MLAGREIILNDGPAVSAMTPGGASRLLEALKNLNARFIAPDGSRNHGLLKSSAEYSAVRSLAAALAPFDPARLGNDGEKKAFWINLYNALVADGIIALDVIRSVGEVRGFFRRIKYRVGGDLFSADDIEHGILRANRRHPYRLFRQFTPGFDRRLRHALRTVDPRIHFALVCGARSCPPIKYYTAAGIDDELDGAAASFINSPEIEIDRRTRVLTISSIFKWYRRDFGGRRGVPGFIASYLDDGGAAADLRQNGPRYQVRFRPYDWSIS